MIPFLLLVLLFGAVTQEAQPTESQARFMDRRELPTDLNLPFHENGFAVVAITFVNNGNQTVKIDTAKVRILDPQNKPLEASSSSEVTPKMVKSGARVPGVSSSTGPPPIYIPGSGRPMSTGATIGPGSSGGGVIDVGRVERLKAAIEKYQLKSMDLLTGEKLEGFLYLKTKKDPEQLKGTRILLTEEITLTVQ